LGPLLFNMYTSDISKVAESHGLCRLNQYADDCQVYLSVPVTEAATAVDQLSQCVANVSAWLSSSRFRLNPSKTLVIWLGGKHQVTKVSVDCVPILLTTVPTVESVRTFDLSLIVSSPCVPTSILYADQRTISCVSCDLSCVRCRPTPPEQSSKRLFRLS